MKKRILLITGIIIAFAALMRTSTPDRRAILLTQSDSIATSSPENESLPTETSSLATSSAPVQSRVDRTARVTQEPEAQPTGATSQIPAPEPLIPDSDLYAYGLERTVNLICIINKQEFVTATGAIISPSGHILTNAHIIDRSEGTVECSVRRGSPAKAFASANLVFLPKGYSDATTEEEKARYDFSIWKMREPGPYAFWPIDFAKSFSEQEVLRTQSYPAELLGGDTIMKSLSLVFSNTAVTATDTFIVKSTSNLSAQHGSSGGILIDPRTARIRALIFAVGPGNKIQERDIYSLAPRALEETVQKETGESFSERFTR